MICRIIDQFIIPLFQSFKNEIQKKIIEIILLLSQALGKKTDQKASLAVLILSEILGEMNFATDTYGIGFRIVLEYTKINDLLKNNDDVSRKFFTFKYIWIFNKNRKNP